ncbi:zinc ABC transporter ATP-binding protein AztA [Mycolicibacterium iranicum]|uniref:ABC transporter n=1 Tax=Mycolicibacterium iranicum TaxID=912594 RepID=A0A178M3F9_MYCIR|nr:zinc ABC transporter ATP-binding protein AztA [Mycolicibacterium iranicum]OAN42415.1 ABC transporter [Mycolicibacterium iranicum]
MKLIFNKVAQVAPGIAVSGVDFGYPGSPVFQDLTLSVRHGCMTSVVGSNGSGKSTLLSLLAGVVAPDRGTVNVDTTDVALAVQRSEVTDSFPITVAEAVMMGRWRRLGLLRRPKASDHAAVDHWLIELGLVDLRRRTLGELSGGQRQRVLLAQTFAQESSLLLLDEPTTGLDAASAALVIGHLRRLAAAGTTVVAATHDPALITASDERLDLDARTTRQ